MERKTVWTAVVAAVIMGVCVAGVTFAQQGGARGQRGGAPGGGFGGGMRGRMDPAQMQQMMMERMKEYVGSTDEEWQAIRPRLEKVYTLSRQTGGGLNMRVIFMGGAQRGGRQGGPQAGAGRPAREQSAVEKAADALREAVDDEAATPEQIKAKLTALRGAREKAKQELAKAQAALREVLTVRQEAKLVVAGLLD